MKALALFALLTVSNAFAGPIAGMTCMKGTSFAIVGVKTNLFATSNQRILAYDVTLGELDSNGNVLSSKKSEQESNMKIFDTDRMASEYVNKNSIVIPFSGKALIVDVAKKRLTVVDPAYETIDVYKCLSN